MKKLIFLLFYVPILVEAQSGSEIYLFDVQLAKDKILLTNPQNVTNHQGYDNQPYFDPNRPILYYSSFNEDGRADIKTYNFKTGKTANFTSTNEREYSPTITPDAKFISCIIQHDNNAQDLGKYPINGGPAVTLIDNLIVGYHAWVNKNNLVLFVLGEPMTLQWYDLKSQKAKILADNIGRSLHKIPGEDAVSFVDKQNEAEWMIKRIDATTQAFTTIGATLPGREDLTWTDDGRIIMSDGEKLFYKNPSGDKEWLEIDMKQGENPLHGITRLAITRDGKKLAVVATE
ncbi:MAG: hypothetical protein RIA63_06770 [Cyclobacteriaceae bacterium]